MPKDMVKAIGDGFPESAGMLGSFMKRNQWYEPQSKFWTLIRSKKSGNQTQAFLSAIADAKAD